MQATNEALRIGDNDQRLTGVVNQLVPLARFILRDHHYAVGANVGFNGNPYYPFPKTEDFQAGEALAGWGCGIYAVHNILSAWIPTISLEWVMHLAMRHGASPDIGCPPESNHAVLTLIGCSIIEIVVNSLREIIPVLALGQLAIVNIWEMEWDQCADPSMQGDGHYAVIAGVDHNGNALVMNSSLRPMMPNGRTYGVMTLTDAGYQKIASDCDGQFNGSGTAILPGARWFSGRVTLVSPPKQRVITVYGNGKV